MGNLNPVDNGKRKYIPLNEFLGREPQQPSVPAVVKYSDLVPGNYAEVKGNSYFKCIQNLNRAFVRGECPGQPIIEIDGEILPQPLTLKEIVELRVKDYAALKNEDGSDRTRGQRLRLLTCLNPSLTFKMDSFYSTATAMVYKARSKKRKLMPFCEELVKRDLDIARIRYDSFDGIELPTDEKVYNARSSRDRVLENPAWIEALEGDTQLLKEYVDIIHAEIKGEIMGFYICPRPKKDMISPIVLDSITYCSDAIAHDRLDELARFLTITKVPIERQEEEDENN